MLLADGNGPLVDEVEVSPTVVASPTIATQSSTLVSPTPTPKPEGWLNGTTIFWGVVIVLVIAGVIYWIRNRK